MKCPICLKLSEAVIQARSLTSKRDASFILLAHQLRSHPCGHMPVANRLPWDDMPKLSPMIESITERDN